MHSNMNKENDFGFWKVKEEGLEVFKNSSITGWRRTLEFFEFVDYPEKKTDWLMQEYSITQKGECGADKEKVFFMNYSDFSIRLFAHLVEFCFV